MKRNTEGALATLAYVRGWRQNNDGRWFKPGVAGTFNSASDAFKAEERKALPDASERLRVNMGWQCPECHGPNVETPQREQHVCTDCGCQWDRRYYPSLAVKEG